MLVNVAVHSLRCVLFCVFVHRVYMGISSVISTSWCHFCFFALLLYDLWWFDLHFSVLVQIVCSLLFYKRSNTTADFCLVLSSHSWARDPDGAVCALFHCLHLSLAKVLYFLEELAMPVDMTCRYISVLP